MCVHFGVMADSDIFDGEDSDLAARPYEFGLGRGLLCKSLESRAPGRGSTILNTPQLASTRFSDQHMPSQAGQVTPDLGSLITQLAEKLGDSIRAQLSSGEHAQGAGASDLTYQVSSPNVSLVMHSDAKEPPIFRGDGSDKFTVHEWESLMSMYLKRRAVPVHEQSQEIMARLMGKAGDVVRITLRNNKSINHVTCPNLVFDILKQHFSELTYSNMPLADFYNTLPMPREDAMEYWIRLNRMMDVADECLKRQGRGIDDPQHEVSMMFIKHCPDRALASVFKFKSAEKWTASEIQERLDEHMMERKSQSTMHTQQPKEIPRVVKGYSHCHAHKTDSPSVSETSGRTAQCGIPTPATPLTTGVDNDCLRSLVSLLDRLVLQHGNDPRNQAARGAASQPLPRACRACGSHDHSTLSHCKRENLCLRCLSPGHWKRNCPQQSAHVLRSDNRSADADQQLN